MIIGAPEFARRAGISERRVQQLIASGRIKASKVSSRWIIEESELLKRRPVGRPMSPRMARALISAISGEEIQENYDPSELRRIRLQVDELRSSPQPAELLSSWLAKRAEKMELAAKSSDLHLLNDEPLIIASGVSDPKNGISDSNYFEGYVEKKNLPLLKKKYGLIPSSKPNVVLRVAPKPIPIGIKKGYSIADLAEHNESRAERKLIEILNQL
jgi:hypothetical protein